MYSTWMLLWDTVIQTVPNLFFPFRDIMFDGLYLLPASTAQAEEEQLRRDVAAKAQRQAPRVQQQRF
jgi:hypothetical protein